MNIAFILPSLANKGPVILALELVNYFIKDGHKCDVYYFDDIIELDVPCFTQRISFFKKIDFNSYDIIHSHMFRPDVYCAIYKSKISISTKVISTIHTAIYDDLKYAYGFIKSFIMIPIWKRAWEMKDHIVVLTDTAKDYYSKDKFKGLTVINNGREIPENNIPISSHDEELIASLKSKYVVLGSLCVLDRRKGLEQILKLLKVNKNYAFIVVGDGIEKTNLQNIALKYEVQDRFLVLGPKKNGYRFMSYFDLFVIPSRSEGMPLALLEAMALKVPIIGSEIPEFIQEYPADTMTFFTLDNIPSLIKACEEGLKNKEVNSSQAYLNYQAKYTVKLMAEKYMKLYKLLRISIE